MYKKLAPKTRVKFIENILKEISLGVKHIKCLPLFETLVHIIYALRSLFIYHYFGIYFESLI